MLVIDEAKLPPPMPARQAISSSVPNVMPGLSRNAAAAVGISSASALTIVQLRPPNRATAKVYGNRIPAPSAVGNVVSMNFCAAASEATLRTVGIPVERLDPTEVGARWPQMRSDDLAFAIFEPDAGVLMARRGVAAVARTFEEEGGGFALGWAEPGAIDGRRLLEVTLGDGRRHAAAEFVFAAGPWLLTMFPEVMKNKLMVAKRGYYMVGTPPGDNRFSYPNLPNTGIGVPSVDGLGLAVLMGTGNKPVDPDTHDRVPTAEDKAAIKQILMSRFPALKDQPILNAHVCQSDNTVDGNFIIDRHPGLDNVWLVGGGSYHGFKMGPVAGDYTAQRVVGRDRNPELAATFKIKTETFVEGSPSPRALDLVE